MESSNITLIYSYYENPQMFKIHQETWENYPSWIKKRLEVIVIDDCSSQFPAVNNIIISKDFPLKIYRIMKKVDWNWRAARNIGVYESVENSWILITDMDLLICEATIARLFFDLDKGKMDKKYFYTFDRVIAPDMRPYKNHPNTYFLHRELYLAAGGYDEIVSGFYGLDGIFRRRLERVSEGNIHLDGVNIIFYQRDFIPDCSLPSSMMKRKEDRDVEELAKARQELKRRFQSNIKPQVLSFPFERVY